MVGSGTVHFYRSTGSPEFKFGSSVGTANSTEKMVTVYRNFWSKKKDNKTTKPTKSLLKTIIWFAQKKYRLKAVQTCHSP